MRASDIVNQLQTLLPQLTDRFTTDVPVVTITRVFLDLMSVTADKHGLSIGDAFAIVNSDVPIAISSLTRSGVIGTLVTSTSHDLTEQVDVTIRITGELFSR